MSYVVQCNYVGGTKTNRFWNYGDLLEVMSWGCGGEVLFGYGAGVVLAYGVGGVSLLRR
jgi:hypothetical protein